MDAIIFDGNASDYVLTPTYHSWTGMKARCDNPNHEAYHNYGGRGITYDGRWAHFYNFIADLGVKPEGKELDRINPNGNYTPTNCRWVSRLENARNHRDAIRYELDGVTKHICEWAQELGITRRALKNRVDRGWDLRLALTTPKITDGKKYV